MMRVHDDDERYMDSLEAERGKQAERAEMAEQQLVAMKKQFHSEAASKQQEWLEKEEVLKAEVRQLKDQLAGKDHTLQTMRHEQSKMHIKYEANQMLVKSQAAHQERRFHRELDDMHQDVQDQIRNLKQKYNIIIDKLQEENRQLRWNLSQQSQPHVPLSSSASSQPLHDVPRLASFHDITHDDTENQLLAAYMRRKKAMAHSPLLSPVLQPLDDNKPENQEIIEIRSPRDRQQSVSPPNPQDFSRDHGTTPSQRLDQPHRVSPATDARATPTATQARASIEPRSTKTMLPHANYPIPPPPRNITQNTRPVLSEITPMPLSEHDEIETTPEQQDGESEIAIEIPSRNPSPKPPVVRPAETEIHAEDDHVAMEPLPITESMLEYEHHAQSDTSEPKPISMRHSAAYQHDDVDAASPDDDSDQLLHRVYDDQDDSDAYDPGDVDTTLSRSITRRTTRSTTQIDTEDDDDLMASLAPPRGVKGKGKAVSSSPARPTKRANGRPRTTVETFEDKDTTPSSPTSPTQTQTPTRSQTQAQARRGRPRGRGQGQTRPKMNTGRKRGRPAMARVVPPTHVDENDDAPTTKPRKGSKSSPARQQTTAAASQDNEMDQTQPSQESEGLTSSQATTTKRRRLNRTRPKFEEALSTTPIIENYHKDVFAREDAERALAEQRTRQRRMEREQKKFVT
ncbi:hypothetical protein BC940DRAFT_141829 [Gongronella butleri]|nr:hypothetical protein BC940DRAFT_141829 [Gongronella butleri]